MGLRRLWTEARTQVLGYVELWRRTTSYQRGMIIVLLIGFSGYFYVISEFPPFISDVVIYSIGSTLLTVEGFLLGMSSLVRRPERNVPVIVGLVAVLTSVVTISKAYFESIQLRYLSYAPTTSLFAGDVILFVFFIGVYVVSVLWPETRKKRTIKEDHESDDPATTEP
jgi:hypothetical protein